MHPTVKGILNVRDQAPVSPDWHCLDYLCRIAGLSREHPVEEALAVRYTVVKVYAIA